MIRFRRTAQDSAHETLTICTVDGDDSGYYCEELDRETPYVVQVTTGPSPGDDFVGLYDLDGERIDLPSPGSWQIADDVPEDVVAAVRDGWATGDNVVTPEE